MRLFESHVYWPKSFSSAEIKKELTSMYKTVFDIARTLAVKVAFPLPKLMLPGLFSKKIR